MAKRLAKVSSTRGANAPVISYERKSELLGLFMMAIAFCVMLALFSYKPIDDTLVQSYTFGEAFALENNRAENALGLVGATIAYYLIPNFLGLSILIWPLLMMAWGYLFLRNRHSLYLPMYTTFGLVGSFELACFFGWFGTSFDLNTTILSGNAGLAMADFAIRALGEIGSFFIISVLILITALLVIDRDFQKSMDRLEDAALNVRDLFTDWGTIIGREVFGNRKERRKLLDEERARQRTGEYLEELPPQQGDAKKSAKPSAAKSAATRIANVAQQALNTATSTVGSVKSGPPPAAPAQPAAPVASGPKSSDMFTEQLPDNYAASLNDYIAQNKTKAAGGTSEGTQVPPAQRSSLNPSAIKQVIQQEEAPGQVSMKVQEQVQEERAEKVTNSAANVPLREVRFRYPSVELLATSEDQMTIDYAELEENKQILLDKLATYNIQITDINAIVGPTITMYELTPAPGIKISRIKALEDDLAMAMAARGIRMVAPIPGKTAVGIEIPNRQRELVRLRDLIATKRFRDNKMRLPFPMGKTIEGHVFIQDITSMPHLLIAGATGAGKSVCLNTLITGLVYACHPSNLKFVMIDPKKIELQQYGRIVDHYLAIPEEAEAPIVTDVSQALGVLKSCEREMEFRYTLLQKAMVRSLHDYNLKFRNGDLPTEAGHRHLPYLVVVVDELADLMLTAGKEIEGPIARLAQMARAVGIHLILATQRPSVDVITGLIKANFPARIAFQVASKIDSRTILDQNGAQGLVGNGDMLYMKGSNLIRLQGPFISVDEVDCVTEYISDQAGTGPYFLPSIEDSPELKLDGQRQSELDELFAQAARIIVQTQQGSVSLLQRKLSIGYTRSARIVDQLERVGIVGPFEGSKARQVLVPTEADLLEILNGMKV
ncbi:MAG: DNA translocase FtsK [Bacteroidota bacterium]